MNLLNENFRKILKNILKFSKNINLLKKILNQFALF